LSWGSRSDSSDPVQNFPGGLENFLRGRAHKNREDFDFFQLRLPDDDIRRDRNLSISSVRTIVEQVFGHVKMKFPFYGEQAFRKKRGNNVTVVRTSKQCNYLN